MSFYLSAVVMGLMSGGHCLGMCGPLVLALPVAEGNRWKSIFYRVAYNIGRTSVYTAMGAILGVTALGFQLKSAQKQVAYVSGAMLILFSLIQLLPSFHMRFFSTLHGKISAFAMRASPRSGIFRFWILGSVNGFLPCGMVAAALVAAASGTGVGEGVYYMLFFGLGTFPLMLLASLFGVYLAPRMRQSLAIIGPLYGIALGVLLILRPGFLHPACH